MFANSQGGGLDMGFPDVCLTPIPPVVAPVPYPNIATGSTATGGVYTVLISGMPAHNIGTQAPMTNGDNAGVASGVASGMVMGPSRHLTGSFTVLLGGMPATKMTSMSLQNSTNCPGCRIAPSQAKVLLLAP
jgi:hypothetical protein